MLSIPDMAILGVLALLVFGEKKLPGVMRQAGRIMRDVQNTSQSFLREMERAADVEEPIVRSDVPPADIPAGDVPPADVSTVHNAPIEATIDVAPLPGSQKNEPAADIVAGEWLHDESAADTPHDDLPPR